MANGLTYNGIHSSTYNIVVKSSDRAMLPQIRKKEIVIPGRHGTYDFYSGTFENRIVTVDLKYVGSSLSNLRTNARSIAAWLETLSASKTLYFDDEPDKYYKARIFPGISLANLFLIGEASVQFECEPFAYADFNEYDETYQYDSTYEYDDGLYYPNANTSIATFDWLYNPHTAGFYNHATYKTPAKFTITGSVKNIIIYNETTSATMIISATITSGETLVINTNGFTAEIDGVNILSGVSGDWIYMAVGENGFRFSAETLTSAVVTLEFTHKWI